MDEDERENEASPTDGDEHLVSADSNVSDDSDDSDGADSGDADSGGADADSAGSHRGLALPAWAQYCLAGVAVLVVLAFILIPRLTESDPLDAVGEEGSPARAVAAALDGEMTCTAGEIGKKHSVLACYHQSAERIALVFVQSDREGKIASYTVETQPLVGEGQSEEAIAIANKVAAIATPGEDFAECSHQYGEEFFCFGALANWQSDDPAPIYATGDKDRLPTVDELSAGLNQHGWDCNYGMCANGDTQMTTAQSLTGLGLQFSAPVTIEHVQRALTELLDETPDTDDLMAWVDTLDGSLSIVVGDGFVVGYVPQPGGGGMLVVDEVAGVMPDQA